MKRDMAALKYIALITQLGLSMALPVIFGVLIGRYLDRRIGANSVFLFIFTIIGLMTSFRNLYHLTCKTFKKK